VMGCQVIETDDCNGEDNFWLSKDGQHVLEGKYGDQLMLPVYSKDISAAWEVVEKFEHIDVFSDESNEGNTEWHCRLGCWNKGVQGHGIAPTAPLAICHAALKASVDNEKADITPKTE